MIEGFRDKKTERFYRENRCPAVWRSIEQRAIDKLAVIDAAVTVEELRIPPSNHLEKLKGDRQGQWSIRINNKYRICFEWNDGGPEKVEIVDYH